jgi:oxysterol-binding protein-related protein 8
VQSDGDTPEKQAEQIKAIYPVVKGQKASDKNAISLHSSVSKPSAQPAAKTEGDLIDFGSDDKPAEKPAARSTEGKPAGEIQNMLASTGKPAPEGPLIDFAQDLKKDLPASKGGLKRSDTAESNDEFFDTQS